MSAEILNSLHNPIRALIHELRDRIRPVTPHNLQLSLFPPSVTVQNPEHSVVSILVTLICHGHASFE